MKSFFWGALASSLGLVCLTSPVFAQSSNLLPTPTFQNPWNGYSAQPVYQTARMFEDSKPEAIPTPAAAPQEPSAYNDSAYEVPHASGSSATQSMPAYGAPQQGARTYSAPSEGSRMYSAPSHGTPAYSSPSHGTPGYSSPAPMGSSCVEGSGSGAYAQGEVIDGGYVEGGSSGWLGGWGGDYASAGAINNFTAHRYGGGGCWYGYVNGMVMTRKGDDFSQISFDTSNPVGQLLSSKDAAMDWSGGVEVFLGHRLSNCWAVEVGYWGLYPSNQEANAYDPDGVQGTAADLNTVFDFTTIGYDDGGGYGNVNDWYDNAARHRLRREFQYHNAEVNFVYSPQQFCCSCPTGGCGPQGAAFGGAGVCGPRFNMNWLFGFRYMNIGENWEYASDETDTTFDGSADELYYNINTKNDLFGFQFGGNGAYRVTNCLTADFGVKFGLFNNHMTHHSRIGGAGGAATVVPGIPNEGRAYDIRSSDDAIAMLGEIKAGVNYKIGCHWSINAGYRAVAVNGVALPQDQIPRNFADIDGVANINKNGCLLLHGAYGGVEFCY
ncbi:BBP7 family outer membrane beta-barrel protein [Lignipirellula cremea]|uniref:Outer membrane protein beta-barrel domain-containing protein n=1 Tax=Lignipirellula cremea TaxID=2528010 RepID=A0A518DYF3_9BACT|nr:BBP7 family outer membrane beta-barrel protein [Lignipirellula cremea]QDU96831.1 hypothetical protein Pla8534_46530 [Lignipirellula cremea]